MEWLSHISETSESERYLRTSSHMGGQERPTIFCSETTTYVGSGKKIKRNNTEAMGKYIKNRITYLIN